MYEDPVLGSIQTENVMEEDLATVKYPIVAWGGRGDRKGSRPGPRFDRNPKYK